MSDKLAFYNHGALKNNNNNEGKKGKSVISSNLQYIFTERYKITPIKYFVI
jgi:hypothetical protein